MAVERHGHDGHDSQRIDFKDLENQDYKYLSSPGDTTGDLLYYDGNEWNNLSSGTTGYLLSTNATASAPTWINTIATPTTPTQIANKGYVDTTVNALATGEKVFATTTAVTVTNSETETDLINITIPGGTLGTNNAIKGKLWFSDFKTNGGSLAIKMWYATLTGGNDFITFSYPAGNAAGRPNEGTLDFVLTGDGATNAQQMTATLVAFTGSLTPSTSHTHAHKLTVGSKIGAGWDSTTDQTLKFTVTLPDATDSSCVMEAAEIYKLTD